MKPLPQRDIASEALRASIESCILPITGWQRAVVPCTFLVKIGRVGSVVVSSTKTFLLHKPFPRKRKKKRTEATTTNETCQCIVWFSFLPAYKMNGKSCERFSRRSDSRAHYSVCAHCSSRVVDISFCCTISIFFSFSSLQIFHLGRQ